VKNLARILLAVATALILVFPETLSAKDTIRPKRTKPSTQEQVVKPVLLKISPQLSQDYDTATREPSVRPVYTGGTERTYENPIVRTLDTGKRQALRDLQGWLDSAGNADGRKTPPVDANISRRADTPFFQGRPQPLTQSYVDTVRSNYPSFGGGILLEGKASGLPDIDDLEYDPILNAFVLNESTLYFAPIAPQSLAALCRAIAVDQRVGASIGEKQLIYGEVPHDSQVAVDLKMADRFLANIALARSWIPDGYPLAEGYAPKQPTQSSSVIVQFNLNGYRFADRQDVVRLAGANFDVRVIPISENRAQDGGFLADDDAIARGFVVPEYDNNVKHVAKNIDYYRRERVVDRMLRYGEVAALLRALHAEGVDLTELAEVIEQESGVGQLVTGPPVDEMQAPIDQIFAAWNALDLSNYLAQWSHSAMQYGRDTRTGEQKVKGFAEIAAQRQRLFPQLGRAFVYAYEPIYLGLRDGVAHFHNTYRLAYWEHDGTPHGPWPGCEYYKIRNEGGRWVILENREDERC
jgi:hypothetical protein